MSNVDDGEDKAKRNSCRLAKCRGYPSRNSMAVSEKDAGACNISVFEVMFHLMKHNCEEHNALYRKIITGCT